MSGAAEVSAEADTETDTETETERSQELGNRCSDGSRERGDPLAGTGGHGERWLLVEIDGSWGRHAFFESRLDPMIGRALVRRAEDSGFRPVAIRRLGRRADERRQSAGWRWAIADSRLGCEAMYWGAVDDPADLLELPLDGSAGENSADPVFLVCTHARHDQCCAVRGRPVAQALADEYPSETWESSHLGGDRFAATMVLLPHGLAYGRVPPEDASLIVDQYRQGKVVETYFRGRTSVSLVLQAAQSFARRATGDDRIDTFMPLAHERNETDTGWRVDLRHDDAVVTVLLRDAWSAPLLSTCAAIRPARVRQYELESITLT